MGMLSYSFIFASAVFGLLHQPWWFAAAGALLLVGTLPAQHRLSERLAAAQAMELAIFAGFIRLSFCAAAASTAFVLGRVCAWVFGI
jgi:hypothetical protein